MQRIITRDLIESDKRVEFNWWLKEENVCDYCMHKETKTCDYCAYSKKRRFPFY